jgi:para-nitrobenzyl esterase
MLMITRRSFLVNNSLAVCAFRTRNLFAFTVVTPTVVRATSGTLRGESRDGVRVFRGVPFAEPPVGALRFLPTEKVTAWKGEREASQFSAASMQSGLPEVPHSEDCLYLNIWAPEGSGPFPVFVWIHGGGFTDGHAFEPLFDGTEFAREDIISISVGYRLGVFGFLD